MPDATWVLGISALYLVICLILGVLPGRGASASTEGFVAGDRSLGLVVMYFITGATIFSAFAFLGLPGWAYSRGASAFYILGYGTLGFVPFYFLGPRASRVGRKLGFVTQAQMMATRFRSAPVAGVMAAVSLVAFVPYLALQMKGAGFVLETVSGGSIPTWVGAAVVYGVVLVYVLKSGVLGVGWTNTFQGLFMMLLAWGLGLYLPHVLYGGVGPMFEQIAETRPELLLAPGLASGGKPWSFGEYGSAVIVSIVGFSVWPHLFMKAFTAKSEATLQRTVVLYPTFQIFLLPLLFIGFAGVHFASPPASADQILPHILMNSPIPASVVGLFCAGALAASMSSGDAMAHAAAAICVRDGVVTAFGRTLEPARERALIRWAVVGVMVVSYLVAVVYQGSLVILLLTAYGAVVQFAPGVVAALYAPRAGRAGVLWGMVAGSLVTLVLVVWPELRPWHVHAGVYGLVVNVATLVALSWGRAADARDEEFVATARGATRAG
ncbi:MAG: sodium:solute symporter family protein [Deltaproteobacteria bacterium]|nr:sodium:solute symporter family protein [Deltaproteobacteria bacterium]